VSHCFYFKYIDYCSKKLLFSYYFPKQILDYEKKQMQSASRMKIKII